MNYVINARKTVSMLSVAGAVLFSAVPSISFAVPSCATPPCNPQVPEIDGALTLQVLALGAGVMALIKRKK